MRTKRPARDKSDKPNYTEEELREVQVKAYKLLAAAIIKQFEHDVEERREHLEEQKKILLDRLEGYNPHSKNKLITRFQNPHAAWVQWSRSLQFFDDFVAWRETEYYQVLREFAETSTDHDHPLGQYRQKTKRGLRND